MYVGHSSESRLGMQVTPLNEPRLVMLVTPLESRLGLYTPGLYYTAINEFSLSMQVTLRNIIPGMHITLCELEPVTVKHEKH